MKYVFLSLLFSYLGIVFGVAQTMGISGRVLDYLSNQAIEGVELTLSDSGIKVESDNDGYFIIPIGNRQDGLYYLQINSNNYLAQRIAINLQQGGLDNPLLILLKLDLSKIESEIGLISLSESELHDDTGEVDNVLGPLRASKDVFLRAQSYDFSSTFFRLRGLNSENNKVLINGVEMNQLQSGRAQWNQWGGLNDALRNQNYTLGFKANDYCFGEAGSTTNIMIRASKYRKGGQVSFASANRTYTSRLMGSYFTGKTLNGWAYGVMASRRTGKEGFVEGTNYKALSFFLSVERELNETHSVNVMAIYSPVSYGRSSPLSKEVISLKGPKYNPNWGLQKGELRNSKSRNISAPFFMMSHYWSINERTIISSSLSYQLFSSADSRLDFANVRNPLKNYYQRMPSYFLRSSAPSNYDYQLAYMAEKEFVMDGQLDWIDLYDVNISSSSGYGRYALQEDKTDDKILAVNSTIETEVNAKLCLRGGLTYRRLKSENYARLKDLLGAAGWLDVDSFYTGSEDNFMDSDVKHPKHVVKVGDKYKYHYKLYSSEIAVFVQGEWKVRRFDFHVGGKVSSINYQRQGLFRNGYFQEGSRSLGKSQSLSFTTHGLKAGGAYKISGHHFLELNAGILTKPPLLRNAFANLRQNNDLVQGLSSEGIMSMDMGYAYHSPFVMTKLTAYYVELTDQSNINYFYTQNAIGLDMNSAFVQEIVQGIAKRNIGFEWGFESQILPTMKIKAAIAWAQNRYTKNASLYLSGDDYDYDTTDGFVEGNDLKDRGKRTVFIKNYHSSGGPEQAYQLGFEYRDPEYWWVGVTSNYFSGSYVNISFLRRSEDFAMDTDNQPLANYDPLDAKYILRQEKLDPFVLINMIGGKSWRINNYYLGFFVSVNNLFNTAYRTGGFEDSRKANYLQQIDEISATGGPQFGNRYFSGNGTSYYLNIYIRF